LKPQNEYEALCLSLLPLLIGSLKDPNQLVVASSLRLLSLFKQNSGAAKPGENVCFNETGDVVILEDPFYLKQVRYPPSQSLHSPSHQASAGDPSALVMRSRSPLGSLQSLFRDWFFVFVSPF
jgi:hypothetical protein